MSRLERPRPKRALRSLYRSFNDMKKVNDTVHPHTNDQSRIQQLTADFERFVLDKSAGIGILSIDTVPQWHDFFHALFKKYPHLDLILQHPMYGNEDAVDFSDKIVFWLVPITGETIRTVVFSFDDILCRVITEEWRGGKPLPFSELFPYMADLDTQHMRRKFEARFSRDQDTLTRLASIRADQVELPKLLGEFDAPFTKFMNRVAHNVHLFAAVAPRLGRENDFYAALTRIYRNDTGDSCISLERVVFEMNHLGDGVGDT